MSLLRWMAIVAPLVLALGQANVRAQTIEEFALLTQQGTLVELSRQKTVKAIVLLSYGIGCPIVRRWLPTIQKIQEKFRDAGVKVFLIDSNLRDGRQQLIAEAGTFQIQIPILLDSTQMVAKSIGINRTGEAIVIDPASREILFRGPVDDRLSYGVDNLEPKENYLSDALTQFLAGSKIERPKIRAVGCAINFDEPKKVDYHSAVAPLLAKKCGYCHYPGGVEPSNFWTYSQAKDWAKMIRETILTERMPPWEVDTFVSPIRKDPTLTIEEKRVINRWIELDYPKGRGEGVPVPQAPRRMKGDIILAPSRQLEVTADSQTPWHYEQLMGPVESDLWVSGNDFELSNRAIVQHIALVVTKTPLDLSKNKFEPQLDNPENIAVMLRWSAQRNLPIELPPGEAYRIPKGSFVYLEIHFAPSGKPERETVVAHLKRYKGKVAPVELKYFAMGARDFKIPPHTEKYTVTLTKQFERDFYLEVVGSHLHWRGLGARIFEVQVGGKRNLLYSQRYLFKNRMVYRFDRSPLIKANSKLLFEFDYDNSSNNPARIDPNQTVEWGEDAFNNEMGLMHVFGHYAPGSER